MSTGTGVLNHLRRPEYTGQNRCIPCTILNVLIAAAVSTGLAFVAIVNGADAVTATVIGVVVFGGGIVVIYLRGYLVPYTPWLTKTYLPDRVLRWFDKPTVDRPATATEFDDIDYQATLVSLGAITECDDRDDLCVAPAFQRRWRHHIGVLREKDTEAKKADVAELFELDDVDHQIREFGGSASVIVDNRQVGQWESDASFIADLAADKVFREWSTDWLDYHIANRSQLLNSIRMFIERCPACDAPVTMGQETVESCCRTMDVVAVSCSDCDSRIFEVELTPELKQQL